MVALFVAADADLRFDREVADLTRQPAARGDVRRGLVFQAFFEFVLDVAEHFPVVVASFDIEQDEAVQCVAVFGGVDLGVDDAVAGAGKEADQAGEEVALVLRVDHHLQADAVLPQAGAYDGPVVVDAVV